ncbi:MAG: phosphatase PAP2 family protein [Gammaproteobacteria bacterium]|nr:phosphatase PAP2 family protein [Gammaproteobacteria bacterium]
MPVLAAQSFGIDTLPDSFQVCSFSQLTGTCTSGTSHPHLHAQIQTLIAGDDERTVISGNNSERDGQPTPPLSDDLNPSSGPSDQAGYYLLGAIPLIVGVGGLIGIDHRLPDDNSGIWKRTNQLDLEYGVALTEIGGSLWFGGESRIGRTFWQTLDASTFSTLTVQGLKYIFSRARPYQSSSPNHWFQGSCCQSFPSGEVTLQASFVTPFIIEYHRQDPWVWGLEALPLYDALARMKTQGHWQTDVLSGWALGTAFGIFAHNRTMPFFLSYMPQGIMVGWHKSF